MNPFKKDKKKADEHVSSEAEKRANWQASVCEELRATEGPHSCRDCRHMTPVYIGGNPDLDRCTPIRRCSLTDIADKTLFVQGNENGEWVYRRWTDCKGFSPVHECENCAYYDKEALLVHIADDAAIVKLPDYCCAHYECKEMFTGLSCKAALKCKNYKYKEEESK